MGWGGRDDGDRAWPPPWGDTWPLPAPVATVTGPAIPLFGVSHTVSPHRHGNSQGPDPLLPRPPPGCHTPADPPRCHGDRARAPRCHGNAAYGLPLHPAVSYARRSPHTPCHAKKAWRHPPAKTPGAPPPAPPSPEGPSPHHPNPFVFLHHCPRPGRAPPVSMETLPGVATAAAGERKTSGRARSTTTRVGPWWGDRQRVRPPQGQHPGRRVWGAPSLPLPSWGVPAGPPHPHPQRAAVPTAASCPTAPSPGRGSGLCCCRTRDKGAQVSSLSPPTRFRPPNTTSTPGAGCGGT